MVESVVVACHGDNGVLGSAPVRVEARDGGVWAREKAVIPIDCGGTVARITVHIEGLPLLVLRYAGGQYVGSGDTLTLDFVGGAIVAFSDSEGQSLVADPRLRPRVAEPEPEPEPELPTRRAIALSGF